MKQLLAADCLIPVAGLSSRFKIWKPLLQFEDKSLIEHAVANAEAVCSHIIVVSGYRGEEIKEFFSSHSRVTVVNNPLYQQGMVSSIKRGLKYIENDYFFIVPGDMPLLLPQIFLKLWKEQDGQIMIPQYEGKPGHPVLIPKKYSHELKKWEQKRFRSLLLSLPHKMVEFKTSNILMDVDTEEDYKKLLKLSK
ncbi:MAG: nucleotidyltransferase family protein [Spirochaetes bacterium]|nr:nucleotidyltransferase family protein [Spirochaetota bacterium]